MYNIYENLSVLVLHLYPHSVSLTTWICLFLAVPGAIGSIHSCLAWSQCCTYRWDMRTCITLFERGRTIFDNIFKTAHYNVPDQWLRVLGHENGIHVYIRSFIAANSQSNRPIHFIATAGHGGRTWRSLSFSALQNMSQCFWDSWLAAHLMNFVSMHFSLLIYFSNCPLWRETPPGDHPWYSLLCLQVGYGTLHS